MGVADPGDIFDGGAGGTFVNKDLKLQWASQKTQLGVVGATLKHRNQFGDDEVRFEIVTRKDGGHYTLTLPHNEVRERQAKAILELLTDPETNVVGPVYLVQGESKGGKKYWALSKAGSDEAVENIDEPEPVAASAASGDDGIPF